MNATLTLRRLRTFLRVLAAVLFAGTTVELILAGHTDEPIQWLPFLLCGVGLLTLLIAWRRPGPGSARLLRLVMAVTAAASLLGVWEHFEGNRGFIEETRPDAGAGEILRRSVTGAAPLLAPGILAAAAAVAVASTYSAPSRVSEEEPERATAGSALASRR